MKWQAKLLIAFVFALFVAGSTGSLNAGLYAFGFAGIGLHFFGERLFPELTEDE